jgi:hypothetical protein
MMDSDVKRLAEDNLSQNLKMIEKYLLQAEWWSAQSNEAWRALWLAFDRAILEYGYEFVIRKRILKRFWVCISQELK